MNGYKFQWSNSISSNQKAQTRKCKLIPCISFIEYCLTDEKIEERKNWSSMTINYAHEVTWIIYLVAEQSRESGMYKDPQIARHGIQEESGG